MNVLELVDEKKQKTEALNQLISKGETEMRKLDPTETSEFEKITDEIKKLDEKINGIQNQKADLNIINNRNKIDNTNMENTKKSLIAQINERSLTNSSKAIELAVMEERSISVSEDGANLVQTDVLNVEKPLRDALVLVQAGARFITGIAANQQIPLYSGTNCVWADENDESTDGKGDFSNKVLKPKRVTGHIDLSNMMLAQDTVNMESMIMEDIVAAIATKLQSTILGSGVGSDVQPQGLFYSGNTRTITGATSFLKIVALETAVDSANALKGSPVYVVQSGGKGLLKSTPKVSGSTYPVFILDGTEMNGYPVLSTNGTAKNLGVGGDEFGILFGNMQDLVIAQWSTIKLIVNPYIRADFDETRINFSAYFDFAKKRDESFAIGSIK